MKRVPPFATEAALCAAFIAWARPQGWTSFNETAGWDVLLVAGDGTQIGVQAKLRFNVEVLNQAAERDAWSEDVGPDFRAVLVPRGGYRDLCSALGLTLIFYTDGPPVRAFSPELPNDRAHYSARLCWHFCNPTRRHTLPEYVPDVPAGVNRPVQLTQWKCAALKVVAALEIRGHVTRQDFKRYGIDPRRWINDSDWLRAGEVPGQFVRGPALRFDTQHPDVYAQVRAEVVAELASVSLL